MTQVPPWTTDQFALLADGRLNGDARVIGLLLSHAGEEGLSYSEIEELLPDASRDRLRAAVQKLERCKWADRLIGGRGHGDRFIYIACPPGGTYDIHRLAIIGTLKNRMPATGTLNALSVPASPTLSPPSSSYPVPLPLPDAGAREPIASDAERAITDSGELLVGTRDSLRDYLAKRVELDHQHGYVRRLASALNGGDEWMWKDRTGRTLHEGRQKIIASALNELLACDEVGKHFAERPGGFGNLRAKVRYLVASTLGAEQDAAKPGALSPSSSRPRPKFPAPEVSRA